MNMTLHLTDECNMACKYCFQTRSSRSMTEKTARKAVDLSVSKENGPAAPTDGRAPVSTGICFFGGEPLLAGNLIMSTVNYCSAVHKKTGHLFFFKLVTNGTLLDEDFLRFADGNRIGIGFSHDGLMQDDSRVFYDGSGSAGFLDEKIHLLLAHQPDAIFMCIVHPSSVGKFADSVQWLFEKGFRKIYTTPAVGDKSDWTDQGLLELDEQYRRISKLYIDWTIRGESISFPAFDSKIESHILGDQYLHRTCKFGQKQVSIDTDGRIYPCLQFVGDSEYCMGDVFSGIQDIQKNYVVEQGKQEPSVCRACALRRRCKYNCCCRNKHLTGEIDQVSPFTCSHEQLLIRYADEAANVLFGIRDQTFIRKQYENRLRADAWESL